MFNYTEIDPDKCDFHAVAEVTELPNGERLFLEFNDGYIVIFNVGGDYYAIADVCTHDDGPLGDGDLEGHEVVCPRHGARFDIRTGKALTLPAVVDIPSYPIRVIDGEIQIGIPKE